MGFCEFGYFSTCLFDDNNYSALNMLKNALEISIIFDIHIFGQKGIIEQCSKPISSKHKTLFVVGT